MGQESEPPAIRSSYSFSVLPGEGIHWPVVRIVDFGKTRRWPDDVEAIFRDIVAQGIDLEAHRILYRDHKSWYEMELGPEGTCGAWGSLGTGDDAEALAKLRRRWQEDWDAMTADLARIERDGPERPLPEPRIAGIPARNPSDAEIIAMTLRHGADHTKRHLDRLASLRPSSEEAGE